MMMETAATLKILMAIIAARNSPAVSGLANKFMRFLDQISSRKEMVIPCCARKRISQKMSAPRKKTTAPCSPFPSWARYIVMNPHTTKSNKGQ